MVKVAVHTTPLSSKKVFEKKPTFPTPAKESNNKTWTFPV